MKKVMIEKENNSTFQKVIEAVEALPCEAQEMLVNIIQNRLRQKKRDELIQAVTESREAYLNGNVTRGTVADFMKELEE